MIRIHIKGIATNRKNRGKALPPMNTTGRGAEVGRAKCGGVIGLCEEGGVTCLRAPEGAREPA